MNSTPDSDTQENKALSSKLSRQRVSIPVDYIDGRAPEQILISAVCIGRYAVHRNVGYVSPSGHSISYTDGYSITHLASGRTVYPYYIPSLLIAMRMADDLNTLPDPSDYIKWDEPSLKSNFSKRRGYEHVFRSFKRVFDIYAPLIESWPTSIYALQHTDASQREGSADHE